MKPMLTVLMAATLLAAPLYAQSKATAPKTRMTPMTPMTPKPDGMMAMMMSGDMMPMPDDPSMILMLKESLELSADQVTRLTAIQATAQAGMKEHMMEHMQGMQSAATLLEPVTPNFTAYEAELRKAANHMVLAHLGAARADADARGVLTPMQRDRLSLARKMMKEMNAKMMKDGMMKDGMMKDGMMKDGMMKSGAMPPAAR